MNIEVRDIRAERERELAREQEEVLPGIGLPKALFFLAAFLSFAMSIYLFFSGDREQVVTAVAAQLGDLEHKGACTPVDKVAYIEELKEQGYRVEGLFMKNWEEDDGTEGVSQQAGQLRPAMGS